MRQRNIHDKVKASHAPMELAAGTGLVSVIKRIPHDSPPQVIRVQVDRKIAEVQAELAAAEGDQRQAETQAKDKQKMKKWMKF